MISKQKNNNPESRIPNPESRGFIRFICIAATLVCLLMLPACQPAMQRYGHLVSELRDNVYVAESANYSVQIITGKREDPFLMDGHAGATRDFTVITVTPKIGEHTFTYRVTLNGTEYAGTFLPHPFAATVSADIAVLSSDTAIEVSISAGGKSEALTAQSVKTEQMISADKAVEIAERKLKSCLDNFRADGALHCEIYVRLMANPIDNSGGYYWYVAFIGENQAIYAVLIDPVSMAVAAIRD
ncbi:MAG: hypothetical protein FWD58_00760 [Firmicutes bacterium]|nr:hypothetical protein [Bacillota bacterium]